MYTHFDGAVGSGDNVSGVDGCTSSDEVRGGAVGYDEVSDSESRDPFAECECDWDRILIGRCRCRRRDKYRGLGHIIRSRKSS